MNIRRTGTQDMLTAPATAKGRPAVTALLRGFAIGALMLCGSAPVLAAPVSTFAAQAGYYVTIPDVTGLDIAYPVGDPPSNILIVEKTDVVPIASATTSAGAGFDPGAGGDPAKLNAFAEASGDATTGSASASAFASVYLLLTYTTFGATDPLEVKILFDVDANSPYDSPVFTNTFTSGSASAKAGVGISLSTEEGDPSPFPLEELLAEDDETQIGWLARLAPGVEYTLEVSAAAEGRAIAAAVPEPATLALLGLGIVGLGLSRRRRAA